MAEFLEIPSGDLGYLAACGEYPDAVMATLKEKIEAWKSDRPKEPNL